MYNLIIRKWLLDVYVTLFITIEINKSLIRIFIELFFVTREAIYFSFHNKNNVQNEYSFMELLKQKQNPKY